MLVCGRSLVQLPSLVAFFEHWTYDRWRIPTLHDLGVGFFQEKSEGHHTSWNCRKTLLRCVFWLFFVFCRLPLWQACENEIRRVKLPLFLSVKYAENSSWKKHYWTTDLKTINFSLVVFFTSFNGEISSWTMKWTKGKKTIMQPTFRLLVTASSSQDERKNGRKIPNCCK